MPYIFSPDECYNQYGEADTTRVDFVQQNCITLHQAKKQIRQYRAFGYELYDERTHTEYAGDLKTVYDAIDFFAYRNDCGEPTGGYRLVFRRDRSRYQHINRVLKHESKMWRAEVKGKFELEDIWKAVGYVLIGCGAAIVAIVVVAVFAVIWEFFASANVGESFSTTLTVLVVIDVCVAVLDILVGIYLTFDLIFDFVRRYRMSRIHHFVRKDRRHMRRRARRAQTAVPAIENGPHFVDVRDPEFLALVAEYNKEHANEISNEGEPSEECFSLSEECFSLSGDWDDSPDGDDKDGGMRDESFEDVEKGGKEKKMSRKERKQAEEDAFVEMAMKEIEERERMEDEADGEILADLDAQRFATVHMLYEILEDLGNFLTPEDAKVLKDADIDAVPHILDILYNDYSSPDKSDVQDKIKESIEKLNAEIYPKLEELQAEKLAIQSPDE